MSNGCSVNTVAVEYTTAALRVGTEKELGISASRKMDVVFIRKGLLSNF